MIARPLSACRVGEGGHCPAPGGNSQGDLGYPRDHDIAIDLVRRITTFTARLRNTDTLLAFLVGLEHRVPDVPPPGPCIRVRDTRGPHEASGQSVRSGLLTWGWVVVVPISNPKAGRLHGH